MSIPRGVRRRSIGIPSFPAGSLIASLALFASGSSSAFDFDTGVPELKLRWDNTVKYSAAFRVGERDGSVLAPSASAGPAAIVKAINADDGDRNFDRGLISNRIDLLSEFDLAYRDVGLRFSGSTFYDGVYEKSNDNNSAGLFGPGSSTSNSYQGYNEYTDRTRGYHGSRTELLDGFAYGKLQLGDTLSTIRIGQHALVWGESLFLGANAIAGAQNGTDIIKAASVPNTQFKEIVLPTNQVSFQSTLSPVVSIGGYYQFRYVPNRIPAVGSYFSVSDLGPLGTGYAYVGPNTKVPINVLPTKGGDQWGTQVKLTLGETDVGFYALRFTQKNIETYPVLGFTPTGPAPTSFAIARQQGIMLYGASFSRTFDTVNVAGEASIRRNTDLATARAVDISALTRTAPNNNTDNTAYPIGNTAHANLSTFWTVPVIPALWNDASVLAEVAWNRMLSCERVCTALPTNGSRDAWQFAGVFVPNYYQVIAGLNLTVPIGLTYTPRGSRSMALGAGPSGPENGGSVNIGLQGLYLDRWRMSTTYTHYFGASDVALISTAPGVQNFSYKQSLKDRDFVSLSVSRTF